MKIKRIVLNRTIFKPADWKQDGVPKIVFIGRSNVGKSSLINKLVNIKGIARTSSKPGKTVSINYFLVNDDFFLVDMPGYGYAKISKKEGERVRDLIRFYFSRENDIKLVVLLIDSRRGFMQADIDVLEEILNKNIKILTIMTKSDKLSNSELRNQLKNLQKTFKLNVIPFSIKSGGNEKEEILKNLNHALTE